MTKTLSINEISSAILLRTAKDGDELILEENGKPVAKVSPISNGGTTQPKQRVFGLGKGTTWMSDDFDDELPDEFWGFDEEL